MAFLKIKTYTHGYIALNTAEGLSGSINKYRYRDKSSIQTVDINYSQDKVFIRCNNENDNFELTYTDVLDIDGVTFDNNFDLYKKMCEIKEGQAMDWNF